MAPMRAGPDASFMLEHGQCATDGAGLREQLDLAVVEPHAVRDHRALGEDAALVEHLERTATEPLQ